MHAICIRDRRSSELKIALCFSNWEYKGIIWPEFEQNGDQIAIWFAMNMSESQSSVSQEMAYCFEMYHDSCVMICTVVCKIREWWACMQIQIGRCANLRRWWCCMERCGVHCVQRPSRVTVTVLARLALGLSCVELTSSYLLDHVDVTMMLVLPVKFGPNPTLDLVL